MLAVNPNQQKKGFAKQLIHKAEELAIEEGCTLMEIDVVSVRPELLSFYGHEDYFETGTMLEWAGVGTYGRLKIPTHLIVLQKKLL